MASIILSVAGLRNVSNVTGIGLYGAEAANNAYVVVNTSQGFGFIINASYVDNQFHFYMKADYKGHSSGWVEL